MKKKTKDRLLEIFFLPPMAIARCGSSRTPADSFSWVAQSNLRDSPGTVVKPNVSLRVLEKGEEGGSVVPVLPDRIAFREGEDGPIHPVAPFFELWGRFQSSGKGDIYETPLSPSLMETLGVSPGDIWYEVNAANRKVQRRTGNASDSFVARTVANGADHRRKELRAFSPHTSGEEPLVYESHPISLGHFQVLRPVNEVVNVDGLNVRRDVLRVRFTPPKGLVYGPATATTGPAQEVPPGVYEAPATQWGRIHQIVPAQRRILNGKSGWTSYIMMNGSHEDPSPQDGYDGATVGDHRAWGCADDSSDGIIQATVTVDLRPYRAVARFFVGPPDFAPDRRPLYSIADDLADRELPSVKVSDSTFALTVAEIVDLFHRAFDLASLYNLDAERARALQENNVRIFNAGGIPVGVKPEVQDGSMTSADKGYVDKLPVLARQEPWRFTEATPSGPLPYTETVWHVHHQLKNPSILLDFLERRSDLVKRIIRPPFARVSEMNCLPAADPDPRRRDPRVLRDQLHDMRMPPYMRDANLQPLSISHRQYRELMDLVDAIPKRKEKTGEREEKEAELPPCVIQDVHYRIFPRNLTARAAEAARKVVGNPVTTRLESAVANCFPGLEFDVRELDRRFFPGLVFQFVQPPRPEYLLPGATPDQQGAHLIYADWFFDSMLPETSKEQWAQDLYFRLKNSPGGAFMGGRWYLDWIEQGGVHLSMTDPNGAYYDGYKVWRMVRGLAPGRTPDQALTMGIINRDNTAQRQKFVGYRREYVNEAGVIDEAYRPGELTESMCNPWSHDFRDCACHYWATNHPDVVIRRSANAMLADGRPEDPPANSVLVNWNRLRGPSSETPALDTIAKNRPYELDHYQINERWETLPFVLEGREIGQDYRPPDLQGHVAYDSVQQMIKALREELGPMELSLAMQYLYAMFSLRQPGEINDDMHAKWPALRDDLKAVRQFLLLVAVSEMTHLRWVNQILWEIEPRVYTPVVHWAEKLPVLNQDGQPYKTTLERLTPGRLSDFIFIERPSGNMSAAYGKCVETLRVERRPQFDLALKIDGEGIDHYERFSNIKRILGAYEKVHGSYPYLRDLVVTENDQTLAVVKLFDSIRGCISDAYLAEAKGALGPAEAHIDMARGKMLEFQRRADELARLGLGVPLLQGKTL